MQQCSTSRCRTVWEAYTSLNRACSSVKRLAVPLVKLSSSHGCPCKELWGLGRERRVVIWTGASAHPAHCIRGTLLEEPSDSSRVMQWAAARSCPGAQTLLQKSCEALDEDRSRSDLEESQSQRPTRKQECQRLARTSPRQSSLGVPLTPSQQYDISCRGLVLLSGSDK